MQMMPAASVVNLQRSSMWSASACNRSFALDMPHCSTCHGARVGCAHAYDQPVTHTTTHEVPVTHIMSTYHGNSSRLPCLMLWRLACDTFDVVLHKPLKMASHTHGLTHIRHGRGARLTFAETAIAVMIVNPRWSHPVNVFASSGVFSCKFLCVLAVFQG